jgi:glycosyltransferase involved in cell wall biosynthesis
LRAELGLTPDENVLCMVARIAPEKHQDLALRSLSHILIAFPETTFLFVGEAYPPEASYHEYLRKCASSGGMEKRVRWLGFEGDIARVYAICDALVACNPQEPFGRCIIEALAMGLPVIAPRTGGHTEFLLDGHDVLLYEPGDSEDLALRAIQLLSDHCVRASIAKNGLGTAATLDIRRHVARVQGVYEDLLCKPQ